jgi:hypothetical protein
MNHLPISPLCETVKVFISQVFISHYALLGREKTALNPQLRSSSTVLIFFVV